MALTVEQFTQHLTSSGVMLTDELREWLASLPADKQPQDGESLARELVRQKKLTKFQAEQIYAGKGETLTLGNYVILDKLGQGGMGMVLKAMHRRMERIVAIKVMSPAGMKSPDAVQRFQREVKAAAKLSHPNIVAAHDADEAKGTHFLVMEFVDGTDLSALVKKRGPLPVEQAIQCIIQAARGLEYAHEQGIIHRDIKPANLLIDAKGTVKILDMGLARIEDSVGGSSEGAGLTSTGTIMGTVDYMSPEQAMDTKQADARSDIYSLGCSLHYLLVGKCVYDGDTIMKKLMAHQHAPLPSLVDATQSSPVAPRQERRTSIDSGSSTASSGVAGPSSFVSRSDTATLAALDAVFRRMVAKKPQDRQQSMTEVIADLERCLSGGSATSVIDRSSNSGTNVSVSSTGGTTNDLKDFLRQIAGRESPTVTAAQGSGTAVSSSSVDAPTMISTSSDALTNPGTDKTQLFDQASHPIATKDRGVPSQSSNSRMKLLIGSITAAVAVLLVVVFAMKGNSGKPPEHKEVEAESKTTKSSSANYALRFDDGQTARIGSLKFDAGQDLTIEAFVTVEERADIQILSLGGYRMVLHKQDAAFQLWAGGKKMSGGKTNSALPLLGRRVHLAFVKHRTPGTQFAQYTMFTDGKQSGGGGGDNSTTDQTVDLILGGAGPVVVDEVRISKTRRYHLDRKPQNFTPPERFEADADTLALYHFDEGEGEVIKDSSGNNHHGTIFGAKWVRVGTTPETVPKTVALKTPTPYEILTSDDYEWTPPENLGAGVNTVTSDMWPTLSGDGLRLVFFSHGRTDRGLSEAVRSRIDEPFDVAKPLGEDFSHGVVNAGIGLSADGLILVFASGRLGGPGEPGNMNLWQATRPDLSTPFSKPVCLNSLNTEGNDEHPWLSADGLTIRFQSSRLGGHHWMSQRASRDAEFAAPTQIEYPLFPGVANYSGVSGHTLSSDERVLIFAPGYHDHETNREVLKLLMSVRPSRDAKFGTPVDLGPVVNGEFAGEYPTLSADGTTLVFTSSRPGGIGQFPDSDMWITRRVRKNPVGEVAADDGIKPEIKRFRVEQAKRYQEVWAKKLGVPVEKTIMLPGGETLEMMLIPPGEFIRSEGDQFLTRLTKPFYLGKYEVTQAQWQAVMGTNPSKFKDTPAHPVERVCWEDIQPFLRKLNEKQASKTTFSLPTEAQWEYACRAGSWTSYWFGNNVDELAAHDWFADNSDGKTHPVGQLKPNPFGLYDMHGNVVEFCADWHQPGYYAEAPKDDPPGPPDGTHRVARSAGWEAAAVHCLSGARHAFPPTPRYEYIGFRLAASVDVIGANRESTSIPANNPNRVPAPAVAPFDAKQARAHQEAWAKHLGVPVEYTNSIGMKFVLIPPGEFLMGSTTEEIEAALKDVGEDKHWQECIKSESPKHKVILAQPTYLGVNEVTQAEYEKMMGSNPSHFAPTGMGKETVAGLETTKHPVEMVSWNDAAEFCVKLSKQEKLKPFYFRSGETITPLDGTGYRLPSEAEWEFACRAGTASKFWIGDKDQDLVLTGWLGANSGGRTHAAGELTANPFGLYDIHGNVWEWVQDGWNATSYSQFQEQPAINPNSSFTAGSLRVVRGGDWFHPAYACRSSYRHAADPKHRDDHLGFRVSIAVDAVKQQLAHQAAVTPNPAKAPFDANQARAHQEAWAKHLGTTVETTNSVGAKMILIPPGEFLMGSTDEQVEAALKVAAEVGADQSTKDRIQKSERPQHRVVITRPYLLGATEVTVGQFKKFVSASRYQTTAETAGEERSYLKPGHAITDNSPVAAISWDDATAYCRWLSEQEQANYRLPTEAEWEYACRAGTTTQYSSGDNHAELDQYAWFKKNAGGRSQPVGMKRPNSFGLFDMHGNVYEWCQDFFSQSWYMQTPLHDPIGPDTGPNHVIRGGSWNVTASHCRGSDRSNFATAGHQNYFGFRVLRVLDVPAVPARKTP